MTPADYVVPAERVVEVLKGNFYGDASGDQQRHHPMKRAELLGALRIRSPAKQRKFAQQLQHMQRHAYAEHRISFQHYPTGWIYDPPPKDDDRFARALVGAQIIEKMICDILDVPKLAVATVCVDDIKIVFEWAAGQWVSGPAHNAFKRLREAAK